MDKNEEYVRSAWELVHRCDGSYCGYPAGTVLVQDVNGHWFDFPDWSAAAEFTREHEEKVRKAKFDVAHVTRFRNGVGRYCHQHPYADQTIEVEIPNLQSWQRILAILEAELAKLTTGMKQEVL